MAAECNSAWLHHAHEIQSIAATCSSARICQAHECHLRLQDAAVRGSIETVQVKGTDSGWLSMTNVWGAAWEIQNSPQPPLDFRMVDDSGSEVTSEAEKLSLPT